MQPHSKKQSMPDASSGKESKSQKSVSRRSSTKPETTSSHSDFQPPSSQVPRSSQAQSIVRRTTASAGVMTQPRKGKDVGAASCDQDSTPARSNVSSAHRTIVPRKSSKVRPSITRTAFSWCNSIFLIIDRARYRLFRFLLTYLVFYSYFLSFSIFVARLIC